MKTTKLICGAALLTLAASCAQDEMELDKIVDAGKPIPISYKVDTDKMSRATSAFTDGTDISKITVSAWVTAPEADGSFPLPGYGSPNTGNAEFFLNDVLTRNAGSGLFKYESDARYWPENGERLDFYAVVDNENLKMKPNADGSIDEGHGEFNFKANASKPGIEGIILQGGLDEMPDMLYAVAFNETYSGKNKPQKNVSFDFNHAFAQVVVSAEVKNQNLHVVITDMEIHGILDEGQFFMPYKSGSGPETIPNPASWTPTVSDPALTTNITGLMKNNGKTEVVLDKTGGHKTKDYLVGGEGGKENQLLVLPYNYNGRNASKQQTYVQLKGYAYNKAGSTLNPETDALIYGKKGEDGKPVPMVMIVPIEFDWKMGTVNKYNIVFDCGNGGSGSEDPNNPAFIRIGYEVEVNKWTDIDHGDYEYPDNLKH